jgi:MoaA/NifB/PqqE/SkfB family radical SAM enzyme
MSDIRFASIIVTYRCNARCHMCNTWRHPTRREEELGPSDYERLPFMETVNVTGGEPFLRDDIEEVVDVLKRKSRRLVISSNGFFTSKIIRLFKKHGDIGIRISIEGLPKANDELRGIRDGFDRGIRSLIELGHMGVKDIGFGITVSDRNARDMLELYRLSKMMGLEFATAAVHNAFYFHKYDNRFENPGAVAEEFRNLITELLRSRRPKDWFRGYFNYGLMNYIRGNPRLLPCEMGLDSFFIDPGGEIYPCNVMQESMGNMKDAPFDEIFAGAGAERVRRLVRGCDRNCWMIGSVGYQMKKYIRVPALWVLRHKFLGREITL